MLNLRHPEYHRSYACVDLGKIKNNFNALKSHIRPKTKVMAIIKADAYGHGAIRVAQTLEGKADYFGVADIEEALVLRSNGIKTPILILSYTSPMLYGELIENSLTACIYSFDEAVLLSNEAVKLGKTAKIHIAVDTGMTRIGFNDTAENADIIEKISKLSNIEIEGIFSHFARADEKDKSFANVQKKRFDDFVSMLEGRGITFEIRHISNSAAVIDLDFNYDMVRLGIALYGMYPSDEVEKKLELSPAMEVISHIIRVNEIDAGVGVGYNHNYISEEKRRIATVCIGYADGYNRSFSNKGIVLINGKRASVVGKVCMDQIMVDVTDIPCANVGDSVVIMGRSGNEFISAEELGELSGSFNYEVICTLMPRVTRIYCENGKEV